MIRSRLAVFGMARDFWDGSRTRTRCCVLPTNCPEGELAEFIEQSDNTLRAPLMRGTKPAIRLFQERTANKEQAHVRGNAQSQA
jgi:hypothetical protein